ncbi:hypothetical protein CR513_44271, partial [Mucuna pruriens]
MTPFGLIQIAIFIKWCVVIIGGCDIWTACSAPKVSSSMVHVVVIENATTLKEACNAVGTIFCGSVRIYATPIFEPANPILSPHFRTLGVVWREVITIIAIASVDDGRRSIFLLAHNPRNSNVLSNCHLSTPLNVVILLSLGLVSIPKNLCYEGSELHQIR